MRKLVVLLAFLSLSFIQLVAGVDIRNDTPAVLNGRLFILGVGINDNALSMIRR
jgi:hypothetical protein